MKKIFISLIGIICFSFSHAQVYHPFPDSAAKWSEHGFSDDWFSGNLTEHSSGWYYAIASDTLIDSLQYHLIGFQSTYSYYIFNGIVQYAYNLPIQTPGQIIGAYREDSSKKVWFRFFDSLGFQTNCSNIPQIVNSDILIYDFNIHVGDSLGWKLYQPVCTGIDSVLLIDGTYRKSFYFNGAENWIEGIGSSNGLFGSFTEPPGEIGCVLSCFTQNNILLFHNNSGPCDSTNYQVGIEKLNNENLFFLVYPKTQSAFLLPAYPENIL